MPHTTHKAWAGALGGLTTALVAWAAGGELDVETVQGALETLAMAGVGALVGYITTYWAPRNRAR